MPSSRRDHVISVLFIVIARGIPEPDPKPTFGGFPNPKPGFGKKALGLESLAHG